MLLCVLEYPLVCGPHVQPMLSFTTSTMFVFIERVFADEIPKCDKCGHLVKPDIVFFGEQLPERYHTLAMTVCH